MKGKKPKNVRSRDNAKLNEQKYSGKEVPDQGVPIAVGERGQQMSVHGKGAARLRFAERR